MSIFSIEPVRRVRRTRFHLNHEVKTTARFGEFTPILCQEVLPGDTWKLQTEQFIRFAPTLAPVMHRINAYLHYFFVPNRLLMRDSWETFISPSGFKDEERAELPYIHFKDMNTLEDNEISAVSSFCTHLLGSRLLDHLGINFPEWTISDITTQACWNDDRLQLPLLPICAYWLIMDEYFMDENHNDIRRYKKCLLELCKIGECSLPDLIHKVPPIDYSVFEADFNGDYPATVLGFISMMLDLCKRCWEKDYFTSALPDTQRGEEVTLGGVQRLDNAFVKIQGANVAVDHISFPTAQDDPIYSPSAEGTPLALGTAKNADGKNLIGATAEQNAVTNEPGVISGEVTDDSWYQVTDTSGQTTEINPVTINELRRAVKLQEFLEKSMRGGYRLIEQIFAHFGVKSSNKLLDRPQFLGGTSNPVTVTEITGTAGTDITHLGEYSGHLQSFGGSRVHKFRSEEHGWLFCFLSVVPRTNYCQGLARQFQRHDRFDFAWPEFAHLGEQEVWQNELYNSGDTADEPHTTFGYQSRYAEYKYIPGQVSGDFKKEDGLAYWTLARRFTQAPTLSNKFLQVSPTEETNTDIFTIQDDSDYLYCQFYHKILAKRCLPKFGVPML